MRSSSMSWFLLLTFNTSILITQSNQLTEEGHKAFEMGIRAKIYHETPFCEVMSIHVVYKHPKIIFFIWRFWSETTLNTINTGIKSNCLFNFTRGISKHSPEKRSTVMRLLLIAMFFAMDLSMKQVQIRINGGFSQMSRLVHFYSFRYFFQ